MIFIYVYIKNTVNFKCYYNLFRFMKLKMIILLITGMFIASGFLLSYGPVSNLTELNDTENAKAGAQVPVWQKAEYWTYAINTVYSDPDEIDMVVYDITSTDYMIGTNDRDHALVHSIYNINPMLGRQTIDNLDIYENGEPKSFYNFPLTDGASWQSTLYERDLKAETTYLADTNEYHIVATSESGFVLEYNFVTEANWFTKFKIIDEGGYELFSMDLVEHGYGYEGKVFFMRARDLFSTSNLNRDTGEFTVSGHPKYGDFDFLAAGVRTVGDQRFSNVFLTSPDNTHYRLNKGMYTITEVPNENGIWSADMVRFPVVTYSRIPLAEVQISGVIEYTAEL